MAEVSAIEQLLHELNHDKITFTSKLEECIVQVEKEIKILKGNKQIQKVGIETITHLSDIIENVKLAKFNEAKKLSTSKNVRTGFENHLKGYLKQQPNRSAREHVTESRDKTVTTSTSRTASTHVAAGTPGTASTPVAASTPGPASTPVAAGTPGPASTHGTPGTARTLEVRSPAGAEVTGTAGGANEGSKAATTATNDSSEVPGRKKPEVKTKRKQRKTDGSRDRPTVLAQKFTNIFDVEWVEAFEVLENEMKFEETKTHKILLTIVQDAYTFCKKEAEQQIELMVSACREIVHGSKQVDTQASEDPGLSLIKEFREENAEIAIPRLEREFLKETISKYFKETKFKEVNKKIIEFCNRCIRVTWCMNVHDPPVFMCPATLQEYVPERFEGLIATGSQPEYFVWPAIMSHEKGELLTKGRVIYQKK